MRDLQSRKGEGWIFFLVEMRGILEQTRFDVSRGLVARRVR